MSNVLKNGKRKLGLLLPLVLIISLLMVGTVFADDGSDAGAAVDTAGTSETTTVGSYESSSEEPADVSDNSGGEEADASDQATDEEETGQEEEAPSDSTVGEENTDDEEISDEANITDQNDGGDDAESSEIPEEGQNSDDEALDETQDETSDETQDESVGEETEDTESPDEAVDETTAEDEVTLVDENGEEVDISDESSSSSDPWWYVGSVKYAFVSDAGDCPSDAAYCGVSSTPIQAALDYMDDNDLVPSDGILHVEADDYTEDITVDGSSGNGNLSSLKGIVSEGSSTDTSITGTVTISNTTSGFTLSGFTITGSLTLSDNTGTLKLSDVTVTSSSGTGITIENQNGTVIVEEVAADSNTTNGMVIDNTAGTGSVTVTNSEFNHNQGSGSDYSGLSIKTNGKITLDGVSASNNAGSGVVLDAAKGTVIDNSVFATNSVYGLYIESESTSNKVELENVQVDSNGSEGIYMNVAGKVTLKYINAYNNGNTNNTEGVYIDAASGSGMVTVIDSMFTQNYNYGLYILSHGSVTLKGITSEDNGYGAYIDTCDYTDGACLGKGSVTIAAYGSQNNSFSYNAAIGLEIYAGGNITLSNFIADGNGLYGVYIQNDYTGRSGSVTIKLTSTSGLEEFINSISNNGDAGLTIYSNGVVSIADLVAEGNSGDGAYLDNSGAARSKKVALKNSDFNNNGESGLEIYSRGSITFYNVNAYGNSADGVYIDNSSGTGSISISASKLATNDFSGNTGYGIYITSAGTVGLKYIDATGNGYGAEITNTAGEGKVVKITSADFSNSTIGTGLTVNSNGVIYLTSVTSSSNYISGAVLNNSTSTKARSITVKSSEFSSNTAYGLDIDTLGTVSLKVVQASLNGSDGVNIDNCQYDDVSGLCGGTASVKVFGSGNEFSGNGGAGLSILTAGSATLINVTADENSSYGVYVKNNYEGRNGSVTIRTNGSYTNSFSGNGSTGLQILSYGHVSLTDLEANGNTGSGIDVNNCDSTSVRRIKINSASANENTSYGLYIESGGAVTLISMETLSNNIGTYIDNTYNDGIYDVTIRGSRKYSGLDSSNNSSDGLYILTNGNIVISQATVDSNGGQGGYLNNEASDGKFVKLTNVTFDGNTEDGVEILTTGKIIWSGGGASSNLGGNGATLTNNSASTYKSVNISNAEFDGNSAMGLSVSSLGKITLGKVSANDNLGGSGAYLDNCQYNSETGLCEGYGSVLIKGTTGEEDFSGNASYGLEVYSVLSINLAGVDANDNDGGGIYLKNDYTGATGDVKFLVYSGKKYSSISDNTGNGLEIATNGSIDLRYISVVDNTGYGILADNTGADGAEDVKLTNIYSNSNDNTGVMVLSNGAIKASNIVDYEDGVELNNTSAADQQNVTVLRAQVDGVTSGNGMEIQTNGDVLLNNIIATNNAGVGVLVNNTTGTDSVVKVVDSKGENIFTGNSGVGLQITSNGEVSLEGVTAEENGSDGVSVSTSGDLEIEDMYLRRNSGNGLSAVVSADAEISIYKLQSYSNGYTADGDGINLEVGSGSVVKITRSSITGNYGDGIELNGVLDPILTKTTYFGNDINNTGDKNLNLY